MRKSETTEYTVKPSYGLCMQAGFTMRSGSAASAKKDVSVLHRYFEGPCSLTLDLPVDLSITRLKLLRVPYGASSSFTW